MKRRCKGKYDDYFDKTPSTAECRMCRKSLKYSMKSGPNSLRFHLKKFHTLEFEKSNLQLEFENTAAKAKKEAECVDLNNSLCTIPLPVVFPKQEDNSMWEEEPQDDGKRIEMAIMEMVARDALPLNFVEKTGFRNFLTVALPDFRIHDMGYYSNVLLPELKSQLALSIKLSLFNINYISLTSDSWSSTDGKHSLLSVTGHWIRKDDFTPTVAILGTCAVEGRPTARNFEEMLENALNHFGIPRESIVSLVRDGAPVTETMGFVPGVQCYAHLLQLCVKDLLSVIPNWLELYSKCKEYVETINKSKIANGLLANIQDTCDLPEDLQEIRWSSLLMVLNAFLDSRNVLSHLLNAQDHLKLPTITDDEWKTAQNLRDVLEPLAETNRSLLSKFDAPSSVIIPSIRVVHFKLLKMEQESVEAGMKMMVATLMESIKSRTSCYMDCESLKTSSFVDPRFKDSFFETSHKDKIIDLLERISPATTDVPIKTEVEEVETGTSSLFAQFLRENSVPASTSKSAVSEVEEYLREAPSTDVDPFDFWRAQTTLPRLKRLALRFLCSPAKSIETERLWAVSGLICTPEASRLTPENLQDLTFCSMNLKLSDCTFPCFS